MQHLHIFLSSPGDVSRERQLAREVIDRIKGERAYGDRLNLEVVAWDKPGAGTPMPAQMEPQEAINRGLKKPSECDIVIVIFWARMGTPLSWKYQKPGDSRYRSGTEYEFLDGYNAAKKTGKPDVLVYRRKKPLCVDLDDPEREEKEEQWDLVQEFFAEFRNPDGSLKSSYKVYDEPSDLEKQLDQDLRNLIFQYLGAPEVSAWDESRSPYPGLRAFNPEESLIFYGRGQEIDELVTRLSDDKCRFIALVGASGSGKSSLVAAGLLPALNKNAIYGSKDWVLGRFTPGELGNNPFVALASAFKEIIQGQRRRPGDVAESFKNNPGFLTELVTMALNDKPNWAELLLFIDQFEELFTLVDPKYHSDFVNLLELAAKTGRVRTVITLRDDFFHRCNQRPVLNALLKEGQYTLLAPNPERLSEMITQPAKRAGLGFEKGLVQRILDDTGLEPGALALMAYALSQL